jgi:hypothetical protein
MQDAVTYLVFVQQTKEGAEKLALAETMLGMSLDAAQ